jgi:hypothetical protein
MRLYEYERERERVRVRVTWRLPLCNVPVRSFARSQFSTMDQLSDPISRNLSRLA